MAEAVYNVGNFNLLQNRQERKRTSTDIACSIIYGLFFIAWIGIAIYAYSTSTVSPVETVKEVLKCLWTGLSVSLAIFFFTWFSVILLVFYFIMLRWCTKFTVFFTIFLEFLFITLSLFGIGYAYPTVAIPLAMFCYFIFWIEIQILKKADIHMVCKIIVDACKVSIAFPSSLLIALLCLFTTALLCMFVATVIYCLSNAKPVITFVPDYSRLNNLHSLTSSRNYEYFNGEYQIMKKLERYVDNMGLIVVFMILSYWILLVNYLSMLSVLHGMFTSWCRMTNKSVIPRFTILLRHLFYAYRYHIGSFAFMSIPIVPIIQVIRTICANIHLLETKIKENPYNIYCFLVVIGNIISNTSIVCASYGKCFYPSMKDAFKVLVQNSMKFAAARMVITGMIFFGLISIPGIVISLAALYSLALWSTINYGICLAAIGSITILMTNGILFIFSAAADSVLFCHLEELLKNEKVAGEGPEND